MNKEREDIEIAKVDDNTFKVIVRELGTHTEHTVEVDDEYYQKLTKGNITKIELIQLSFRFLLRKEAKELILARFNLNIIARYFPEYEKEISV